MTDEQLEKAEALRQHAGFTNVSYRKAYIQATGRAHNGHDAFISNGVINLAPVKD